MSEPTHLILIRACDAATDGPNLQAKIGYDHEPDPTVLEEVRQGAVELFTTSFGRKPERVAVVVLPWVDELDEDES